MAEWLNATVLKTVECNSSVSSNLTFSAKFSIVLTVARLSPKQEVAVRIRIGMPMHQWRKHMEDASTQEVDRLWVQIPPGVPNIYLQQAIVVI